MILNLSELANFHADIIENDSYLYVVGGVRP